ncbi:MAG: hypothetical protein CBB69_003540 [Phycisphaera sp. TMED9]|nr:MAG: hypothetical protein CBB69_003540 [Phycisphaera sp. TMED9]
MDSERPAISMALPTACIVALGAFLVAILSGMFAENPFGAVLARSLVVMLVSWPIGLILGFILEKLFREHASDQAAQTVRSDPSADEASRDVEIVDESASEPDSSVVEVPVASPSEAS